MIKPIFQRLSNHLPVLSVPMPGTETGTVLVLVRTGSRLETQEQSGLSHFLEHMMFKGTTKRPTAQELSRILDGVGAEYNAYTTKEYTGYYVKAAAQHVPLALEVVSDMLWHSKLDTEEMEREKKVIVEEINMYEDNPLIHIGDVLENALFRGSGLGQLISGTRKSVMALQSKQLVDFWHNYYHPKNMLVVVSGKITPATNLLVKKLFGEKRAAGKLGSFKPFVPNYKRPQVALHYKDTEQVQFALAFPSYGWKNAKLPVLELLATILGGNMSSRLFVRLREKEGLCYSVRATIDCYQGTGLFAVQAGLDRSRLAQATRLVREELQKVVDEPVDQDELSRAKEYSKGRLTLMLEDSASQAEWAGKRWFLENTSETPQEHLQRISQVSASQLQKVAREILVRKKATLALIGPFKDAKPWQKLLT